MLSCAILLDEPERIVEPATWIEHAPFAFWLVDALRPEVFVELGTDDGNSYAAFAQAVQRLRLTTACYSVEAPREDAAAEGLSAEWSSYHHRRFSAFSRIIRSTSVEAAEHFLDGSVDLLHLNAGLSVDQVAVDFECWRPKMSPHGVVLLHGINARQDGSGAWAFWERVRARYASFAFLQGNGLGVLGVGSEPPESVRWLLSHALDEADVARVRALFSRLGGLVASRHLLDRQERELKRRIEEAARASNETGSAAGRRVRDKANDSRSRSAAASAIALPVEEPSGRSLRTLYERSRDRLRSAEATIDALTVELHELGRLRRRQAGDEVGRASHSIRFRASRLARQLSMRLPRLGELRALLRPPVGRRVSAADVGRLLLRPALLFELRPANTVLDPAWYLGRYPDLASKGVNALAHFLLVGDRERRQPHPLFDPGFYLGQASRMSIGATGPFRHFLKVGANAGLNPHPLFDTSYYLGRYPDVVEQGANPLVHYLRNGVREGRQPHPLFDPRHYATHSPDVAALGIDPLTHFLRTGAREGRAPSALFDPAYYTTAYPDVAASGLNPLVHFVSAGWREGRNPSATFDMAAALAKHPELRALGRNPLVEAAQDSAAQAPAILEDARDRPSFDVACLEPVRQARPVVLCVSHVMPWPPRAGNEYRVYRMLAHLRGQGCTVVPIVAPLEGAEVDTEAVRTLAEHFGNAVLCRRDGRLEYILRDVPDVLASLAGELTSRFSPRLEEWATAGDAPLALLTLDKTFCHDPLMTVVLRLQRALGRSVLLAEYIWMSRVLPLVKGDVLKVIDTIDVFSNKHEKVVQHGVQDWVVDREEEARRLRRADVILGIQEEEARQLRMLVPDRDVLTTGVDFDVVAEPGIPQGRRILYLASGNPMNRKGLHDFLQLAWPRIREQVPDAELVVAGAVGSGLSGEIPGVICTGIVDDPGALYAQCGLVINPAVAGTGVKIKTVEALSRLRRIVTWPAGVEGLPAEVAAVCVTVSDWYEFSKEVVRLLGEGASEISPAERRAIERFSSSQQAYGSLTAAIEQFWARP